MHLQQPNIHTKGQKINIRQDFLLASELFIDDLFLIKKRDRHTTFLISTAMILCLSLSAVVILLTSHRRDNATPSVSKPSSTSAGDTATVTTPPPGAPSANNKTPGAPPSTVTSSRPKQSATDNSNTRRVSPGVPVARTPVKTASRKTGSPVATRSPDPNRSTTVHNVPAPGRTTVTSTSSPKKQPDRSPGSNSVFTPSDAKNQFDRSTFYMPADDKNSSTQGRASRGSSSRYSSNTTPPPSSMGNKVNIVANIAVLHGGQLQKTMEHNGDYYKLKLVIPPKQLLSFKKDVAKMVEYASYTNVPEESEPNATCLIMETHFR